VTKSVQIAVGLQCGQGNCLARLDLLEELTREGCPPSSPRRRELLLQLCTLCTARGQQWSLPWGARDSPPQRLPFSKLAELVAPLAQIETWGDVAAGVAWAEFL